MLIRTEDDSTFFSACLMIFLLCMEWGIATTHLPIYIHELGASPFEVGLVFTIFAGIMAIVTPLWGAYSDRIGKRKVFMVIGMFALIPIYFIISSQEQVYYLILLRGCTAIFKGAVMPAIWALISDISYRDSAGRNLGILNTSFMAGFAVGPITGGLIVDNYGFSVLWTFVMVICLVGGLIFQILGSDPPSLKRKDRKNSTFSLSKRSGAINKILVVCFSSAIFLLGFSLLGPNLNVYLIETLGFSKTTVGLMAFVGTGISALAQPLTGSYSDKYGRKPFLILTSLSLILGNFFLFLAKGPFLVAIAQSLITYNNSFQLLSSAYLADVVSIEEKSGALGLLNGTGSVSRSLGAAIGGVMIVVLGTPSVMLVSTLFPAISIGIIALFLEEERIKKLA